MVVVWDGGVHGGATSASDCRGFQLHQWVIVVPYQVRVEWGEASHGRGSCHGHGKWRDSHVVVRIHLGMTLRPISGDGSPAQLARGATNEHDVVAGWVQGPIVALAWVIVRSRNLHKALVEGEIVSNGVLPSLFVLPVVREVLHDVVVDPTQRELSLLAGPDSHHNQGIVGEGRLLVLGLLVPRLRIFTFLLAVVCHGALGVPIARGKCLLQFSSRGVSLTVQVCCTLVHRSCIPRGVAGGCAGCGQVHLRAKTGAESLLRVVVHGALGVRCRGESSCGGGGFYQQRPVGCVVPHLSCRGVVREMVRGRQPAQSHSGHRETVEIELRINKPALLFVQNLQFMLCNL